MIWTEEKVEVVISDEMLEAVQKVLEGLDYLRDIMYENNFYFHTPSSDKYILEDVHNVKEFLETLIDSRCKFEE